MSEFTTDAATGAINSDGLCYLMRECYRMAIKGWEFVECAHDEKNPQTLHLRYQKPSG